MSAGALRVDSVRHGAFLAVVRQDQWLDDANRDWGKSHVRKSQPTRGTSHSGVVSAAERDCRSDDDLGRRPGGQCSQETLGGGAAR